MQILHGKPFLHLIAVLEMQIFKLFKLMSEIWFILLHWAIGMLYACSSGDHYMNHYML